VVQTFRAKGRPNPTKDTDSKLSILLSRQFRAYRNNNPKQVQQKALPFDGFNNIAKRQVTELDRAIVQQTIAIAFFVCHSCKYLEVLWRDMKHTKLLCLRNIRFFKDGYLISAPSDSLELANSIAVMIKMQKNNNKHDTVIHGRTENPNLCPVLQ
jgi:hypothetical protein